MPSTIWILTSRNTRKYRERTRKTEEINERSKRQQISCGEMFTLCPRCAKGKNFSCLILTIVSSRHDAACLLLMKPQPFWIPNPCWKDPYHQPSVLGLDCTTSLKLCTLSTTFASGDYLTPDDTYHTHEAPSGLKQAGFGWKPNYMNWR